MVKPVQAKDLLAVVRGKLRRAHCAAQMPGLAQPKATSGLLGLGRLELKVGEYQARLDDEPLGLSNTEFLLLECLALQANRVVPLLDLIKVTHGLQTDYREASNLLRPMVRSIRRKMGYAAGDLGCIESVRGVGHRLVPPDET